MASAVILVRRRPVREGQCRGSPFKEASIHEPLGPSLNGRSKLTAVCAVAIVALAACGDDEPTLPEPTEVTVCETLDASADSEAAAQIGEKVLVKGLATPLNDLGAGATPARFGFVLSNDDCSIFVSGPASARVTRVDPGETVEVIGALVTLNAEQTERIRMVLELPPGASEIDGDLPGGARIATGTPSIDAFSLAGENAPEP